MILIITSNMLLLSLGFWRILADCRPKKNPYYWTQLCWKYFIYQPFQTAFHETMPLEHFTITFLKGTKARKRQKFSPKWCCGKRERCFYFYKVWVCISGDGGRMVMGSMAIYHFFFTGPFLLGTLTFP